MVLARPSRPKYWAWPDRTDRNTGISLTKQTEIWVLARLNRPKYGYWPERTDRNMGIGQSEQTEIWVLARANRPKLPLARRKARPKFFPDHCAGSHRTHRSATQVGLAITCLGSRTSSWAALPCVKRTLVNSFCLTWHHKQCHGWPSYGQPERLKALQFL